jgi:uroporphyrinogen-III synthase
VTSQEQPLGGCTVAVTATRRSEELVGLLERRGAAVVVAEAIRIVPLVDDEQLRAATEACLTAPLDVLLVTTGIGFRGWLEAADGWGQGDSLRDVLAVTTILARGPKARGAVRAAGLTEQWSPASETVEEMLGHVLAGGVAGRRVAVQLHGEPLPSVVGALHSAGADVVQVPVYRWVPAPDLRPLHRLVEQVCAGRVDCVTFTSAPAAASLLGAARDQGREQALVEALQGPVLAACVGPVTAAPLERQGIPTVQPERARLAALVRTVVEELPARQADRR